MRLHGASVSDLLRIGRMTVATPVIPQWRRKIR